jgi:hypothetical protein
MKYNIELTYDDLCYIVLALDNLNTETTNDLTNEILNQMINIENN